MGALPGLYAGTRTPLCAPVTSLESRSSSVGARNRLIIMQRAAGRTVQSIAAEHGLSVARVSVICQDHREKIRIAELEAEVARLEALLAGERLP